MTIHTSRRRVPAFLLLLSLALTTACTNARGVAAPAPTPTASEPSAPPSESPSPGAGPTIRWEQVGEVALDDRWTLTDCEGDAPLLCVDDREGFAGAIEYLTYPQGDPPAAGDEIAWLSDALGQFMADLQADRTAGCGPDYVVSHTDPATTTLEGRPAIAYTFTGIDGEGAVHELGFAVSSIDGHVRQLIAGNAYDAEGCLAGDTDTWTVEQMESFSAHLLTLATGSQLPPTTLPAGMVAGRVTAKGAAEVSLDTVLVLSGAAAVRAAIADGELPEGEDTLPNDVYVRDRHADELVLPLATDATVGVFDCSAGCELVEVSMADWLSGAVTAYGGPDVPYEVTVHDGVVVRIAEQYLP